MTRAEQTITICRTLVESCKTHSMRIPEQCLGILARDIDEALNGATSKPVSDAPKDGSDQAFDICFKARAFWCVDLKRWVLCYPLKMECLPAHARWLGPARLLPPQEQNRGYDQMFFNLHGKDAAMKEMPTVDVLGVVTGRLLANIGGIYEVLNYMTGESLFTHQLPRVSREAQPVIVARHPALQQAIDESDQVTTENWKEWRDRWLDRYGPMLAVPKFTEDTHERIDPISEAAENFRPDQIITISVPPQECK